MQVVVFSWTGCPYCKRAKALLSDVGAKFIAVELDNMSDGKAIRAVLGKVWSTSCWACSSSFIPCDGSVFEPGHIVGDTWAMRRW